MKHRVQIILGCCLAMSLLSACTATSMRRNLKEAWHDGVVKSDVKLRLAANKEVKARYINVDVFRGVVSLTGRVENASQRQVAEALAQQSKDVVLVENHLAVRTPHDPRFLVENWDMQADAVAEAMPATPVRAPVRAPRMMVVTPQKTPIRQYSDLAVGDPFVGKSVPEAPRAIPQPANVAPRDLAPRVASRNAAPAKMAPSAPVARPATNMAPDRTYSDLAVGDPLSEGRRIVPRTPKVAPVAPQRPAIARQAPPTPSQAPTATAARMNPNPAPSQPRPVAPPAPMRTVQEPRYLDKGVIPPAASLKEPRPVTQPVAPTAQPTAAPVREATRVPMRTDIDSGLAQEAADELRRLKAQE